jgi:hypothetical protein
MRQPFDQGSLPKSGTPLNRPDRQPTSDSGSLWRFGSALLRCDTPANRLRIRQLRDDAMVIPGQPLCASRASTPAAGRRDSTIPASASRSRAGIGRGQADQGSGAGRSAGWACGSSRRVWESYEAIVRASEAWLFLMNAPSASIHSHIAPWASVNL